MSALRIYLNENLSWKIAKALSEYGYDVVSSYEVGMNTTDDETQLAHAVSERRAVLTNNFGDFVRLCNEYASTGKDHWGVIFTTKCRNQTVINRLRNLLETLTSEQMKNQIRWLNEFD